MDRPTKRVRQACDPCRRKKSRCPGEKPVCSYCARLGQDCSYSDEYGSFRNSTGTSDVTTSPARHVEQNNVVRPSETGTHSDTATRLNAVENQLAEVLSALNRQQSERKSQTPATMAYQEHQQISHVGDEDGISGILPTNLIRNTAQLYAEYCHCQPLPLFSRSSLDDSMTTWDRALLFAAAALSLRFDLSLSRQDQIQLITKLADSASKLLMQRIGTEPVGLSSLQALCLLALVDFYDSNTQRASIHISLAVDLSQSAGLAWSCTSPSDSNLHENQMRCFWSITLLVRLHANLIGPFSYLIDNSTLSVYPESATRPPLAHERQPNSSNESRQSSEHKDLGINAYVIQLSEVWQQAAHYARRRRQPEAHPPWSTESQYAEILACQMERETLMPYSRHRYKPANFAERSADELHQHRDYWGPWLLNQMMYHGIICLLNHPLLLSLRLRNFRIATIPEIWLQHTDDLVSSHTRWITHLIELIESKGFLVTDPFLAHPAVIVATIYLQQSFVEDVEKQQSKREGYLTCLRFCRRIGEQWHHISELAMKLERLEKIVSTSYQNSASSSTSDKVYIDLTTFWEILESSLISESPDKRGLTFAPTLTPRFRTQGNSEEVNAHPLPEPSRLDTVGTPSSTNFRRDAMPLPQTGASVAQRGSLAPANDDFAVLAQSYFAQGEDFVGGLDDWWTLNQP